VVVQEVKSLLLARQIVLNTSQNHLRFAKMGFWNAFEQYIFQQERRNIFFAT